jgi:hypothetical protein
MESPVAHSCVVVTRSWRVYLKFSNLDSLSLTPCSAEFRCLRQLRHSPPSSKGLDQQHAGIHTAPQNVDLIPLILESDCLCCENLKVRVRSTDVTIRKNLQ